MPPPVAAVDKLMVRFEATRWAPSLLAIPEKYPPVDAEELERIDAWRTWRAWGWIEAEWRWLQRYDELKSKFFRA
jgi:hypothetical protein